MARYIDEALVNAKLKEICNNSATAYGIEYGGRAEKFARLTENIPTADVVEVKHGEWEQKDKSAVYYWRYNCSLCGEPIYDKIKPYDYCPHCGAKMDGRRDT